ncbi:Uncharacterized protein DAT39_000120 [Clarias magur]|uniref:Uncharacterized protein n=1 Tax=Clarias magur TaxID=1594786 RepID=A0A8J4XHG3_CLAMG|nr:Uncharacterized protein DAT39_000120 [Clarias magur]
MAMNFKRILLAECCSLITTNRYESQPRRPQLVRFRWTRFALEESNKLSADINEIKRC